MYIYICVAFWAPARDNGTMGPWAFYILILMIIKCFD